MSTTSTTAGRPPVRRIVTGHARDGKAIFAEDGLVQPRAFRRSQTQFTDLYWSEGFPSSNDGEFQDDIKQHDNDVVNPDGSVFRAVDMAPHTESFFHRTISLDHCVLTNGSLTLVLDDNKRVVLKPGDVVVQRGTIHAWINETDEWTRMYCVQLRKPVLYSV
ncbi:uncharacterized protein PHACADRAFT_149157 [Phanerochaete carnosa HHB-10118-sp]|uniref:Cupin 2 conserved barrel domain-containing protein n=1 Tax=Phanerochaete carnosa (strain HHB-10118-sp) TaxID=650164 RepID=K5WQ52_PHACS|nr:uncharacterized protein PHACADRAFT_149157 [Phanerochaete carnosa HHB-10118-sp]EKM52472.1 hypothetical protein PHACADRAFT_149157 [Phanerochaete carnosa HHB-10118-sp]